MHPPYRPARYTFDDRRDADSPAFMTGTPPPKVPHALDPIPHRAVDSVLARCDPMDLIGVLAVEELSHPPVKVFADTLGVRLVPVPVESELPPLVGADLDAEPDSGGPRRLTGADAGTAADTGREPYVAGTRRPAHEPPSAGRTGREA